VDSNTSQRLVPDATARAVLRHLLATLSYRAAKVLAGVPPDFPARAFGDTTRTPVRIVAHMGDLMAWGVTLARGEYVWTRGGGEDWDTEVTRFFDGLGELDRAMQSLADGALEPLIQGPLADALTHVGQLALLRGMAGAPVRPESYARAEIVIGRTGRDQAAPKREFDGDASAPA
jgi:hypothetical protein